MKLGEQLVCAKGASAELRVLLCESGQPLGRELGFELGMCSVVKRYWKQALPVKGFSFN